MRVDATHGEAAKPSEASAEGSGVSSQESVIRSWSLELELESGVVRSWSEV